jgi:hypothetical protein
MLAKALYQLFISIVWIATAQPEQQFVWLVRPLRFQGQPRPESPKEKAELQKRVNSLVDKWAVQHAERLKAAKRRRTQSK